jgi:hypothetical protein
MVDAAVFVGGRQVVREHRLVVEIGPRHAEGAVHQCRSKRHAPANAQRREPVVSTVCVIENADGAQQEYVAPLVTVPLRFMLE